jgi:hypothetical protein
LIKPPQEGGNNMKKITVRKTGTVRLTSAAASAYCHGILA